MVDSAYQVFVALDGTAIEGGRIYVGAVNDDPEIAPVALFWDSALSVPAAQPLLTSGGVIVRDGAPSDVYAEVNAYSIRVRDRNGSTVWYKSQAGGTGIASRLSFPIPTGPASEVPGPSNNTRLSLALLKSASTTDKTSLYDGSLWTWTLGDYTGQADDINIVKADSSALSVGAWVRQSAAGVTYTRPSAGSATRSLPAAVAALGITAGDRGAKFDGVTNDAVAIQAMIDDANVAGVPVLFPAGTAIVNSAIDLRGRYVDVRGIPNKTTIRAGAAIANVINAEEATEVASYSPLRLSGLTLNGNGLVTSAALGIRFRRDFVLEELFLTNAPRGIRQKDANNGSMRRVRTSAVGISLHSEGSNHATHHDACSFINASTTAVLIQNLGTALDGNNALVFTACVVQDGAGDGFDVAASTSANLVGCYIGETTTGFNFVNRGGVITVDGGIVYFGFAATNYVARPLGGTTYFDKVQLFSQDAARGVAWLSGLTPAEAGGTGKIKLKDVNAQFPVAGNSFLNGNVLATEPTPVFAPRLGKSYTLETNDITAVSTLAGAFNNARFVTVSTVTGAAPILGLQAMLTNPNTWRDGEPFYLVVVYTASKPINVRTSTGVLTGAVTTLGTIPASASVATYIKVETIAAAATQTYIEFFMTSAAVGDNLTLYQVGFADASMIRNGIGVMSNLYLL